MRPHRPLLATVLALGFACGLASAAGPSPSPSVSPAAPPPASPSASPAALRPAELDDAGWAKYFDEIHFVYVASRSPRELPGPIIGGWVKKLDTDLSAGSKPEDVLGRAVREKVIAHALDILDRGLALGAGTDQGQQRLLMVVPRTPALDKLVAWAKKTYPSGPAVIREADVDGQHLLELELAGKRQLAATFDGDVLVLADRREDVLEAVRTARTGKRALTASRAYTRLRGKAKPGTSAIAVLTPGPALADFLRQDARGSPGAPFVDIALGTLDSYMFSLAGDARSQQVDLWFGLNPKSEGYAKLHLADRVKFYSQHSLKLAAAVPGDIGLFFTGLQPSFDTRELPSSVGYMGQEGAASNQQQWDVLKGQLQVFTGLNFDTEIVPWLGAESCLVVRTVPGDRLEAGVLFSAKDTIAAQASLDKAVRHMAISQNKEFEEVALGPVKARAAKVVEGAPFTPVLAVTAGSLVFTTGRATMEALVQYPIRADTADPHQRLLAAIGEKRIVMMGWAQSAMLARITRMVEELVARQAGRAPNASVAAPLDALDSAGVALAMPEADIVHATVQVTVK